MVLSGALAYIAGAASGFVKDIAKSATNTLKKKVTGPINKAISSVKRGPAPKMPESVAKSAGLTHPVTGKSMSGRERGGHYEPSYAAEKPAYGGTTYAALIVPLLIGAAWLAYVFLIGRSDIPAAQLSPYSLSKQLFLLSTFMTVYVIFLILFCTGKRKAKKNIKKVKK